MFKSSRVRFYQFFVARNIHAVVFFSHLYFLVLVSVLFVLILSVLLLLIDVIRLSLLFFM